MFQYLSFDEITDILLQFNETSDLVDCFYSETEEVTRVTGYLPKCESQHECRILVCRVTNEPETRDCRPSVVYVGALHGDERVGPTTLVEFLKYLLDNLDNIEVDYLLRTRILWFLPTPNAEGYLKNMREERLPFKNETVDPNRDYPYEKTTCMQTRSARAINDVVRQNFVSILLTFHAGEKSITYPWGSPKHMNDVAPDFALMQGVGDQLRRAAGYTYFTYYWYERFGSMNDVVYPVTGGLEDFVYAASFETVDPCNSTGYPPNYTDYRQMDNVRVVPYLVETDNIREPDETSLGKRSELTRENSSDGHIVRNIRLALRAAEMIEPGLIKHEIVVGGGKTRIRLYFSGCIKFKNPIFIILNADKISFEGHYECTELSLLGIQRSPVHEFQIKREVFLLRVVTEFDAEWESGESTLFRRRRMNFESEDVETNFDTRTLRTCSKGRRFREFPLHENLPPEDNTYAYGFVVIPILCSVYCLYRAWRRREQYVTLDV